MKDYSFEEHFEKYPLAMAYVPWQHFTKMYENLEKGYQAGTIFPELDKPFTGRRCVKGTVKKECCTTSALPTSF